jgi:acyl-coenzyme A synthetase/AMP-(fatty) acid ligase
MQSRRVRTVPLDQDYGAAELEYMMKKTQPAAMVVGNSDEFKETASELFPNIGTIGDDRKYESSEFVNLKHLIFINPTGSSETGIPSHKNVWTWTELADEVIEYGTCTFPHVDSDDPYVIMFTSGTTGKPKGIVLNQFKLVNLLRVARESNEDWNFDLVNCTTFLLYHYCAMISALMALYNKNYVLVIPSFKFNISDVLEALEKYQCSAVSGLPKILHSLVNHPARHDYVLSSVTTAIAGGQVITAELIKQFKDEFEVKTFVVLYSLTEVNNFIMQSIDLTKFDPFEYNNCVGKVSSFMECKILDKETGRIVNHNEEGELVIRINSIFILNNSK